MLYYIVANIIIGNIIYNYLLSIDDDPEISAFFRLKMMDWAVVAATCIIVILCINNARSIAEWLNPDVLVAVPKVGDSSFKNIGWLDILLICSFLLFITASIRGSYFLMMAGWTIIIASFVSLISLHTSSLGLKVVTLIALFIARECYKPSDIKKKVLRNAFLCIVFEFFFCTCIMIW